MSAPAFSSALPMAPRETFTTAEGIRCVVVRRGSIPLVAVRLLIAGGSASDPRGLEGLTDFTLRLLRRGTRRRTADALDEAIERVGGVLECGSYEDYAFLGLTVPVPHLPKLLEVLSEMVQAPRFAPAEVRSARLRTLGELANDLDDPGAVADRILLPAMWGEHPYGHDVVGGPRSVRRFGPKHVQAQHRAQFGPRALQLIVVGPVDAADVRRSLERAFRGWRAAAQAPIETPVIDRLAHPGEIWVVDKPEQTQTQLRLGTMSYRRGAPDSAALQVLNTAIGGGFTSRLVNEVRVNRGLSYGVRSTLDPLRAGGGFSISSFTKTESARELLDVVMGVLRAVRANGLGAEELEHAKRYLAGTYPQRVETNESMASGLSEVYFYGLPTDWIEAYRERIHGVTPAQIRAAAERWILSEDPSVVLVGRAREIRPQLRGLGPVRVLGPRDV